MKNKSYLLYGTLSTFVVTTLVFAVSLIDFSVPVVNEKTVARCSKLIHEKQLYIRNITSNIHSLTDFDAIPAEKLSSDIALFLFQDSKLLRWINDIPADEAELFSVDTCVQYLKINHWWFLACKIPCPNFDLVATFLIQTVYPYTNQFLTNEINPALGFSHDISIRPADSAEGSMIYSLEQTPLFKIISAERDSLYSINLILRWIAVVLVLCSIFLFFFYAHRSRLIFLFISLLIVLRAALFFGSNFFFGDIRLFSLTIYTDSCHLSSLGSLLLDAIFAFLIIFMLYHWRRVWRIRYTLASPVRKYIGGGISFAIIVTTAYLICYILQLLSLNPFINLSLQQPGNINIYTVIAYIVLGFMYTIIFLMLHLGLKTFCPKQYHTWLKRAFFFFYLLLMPAYTVYVSSYYKQKLEKHQTAIWANKVSIIDGFTSIPESGYPELLQGKDEMNIAELYFNYSFGNYLNEYLISCAGEYKYPFHLQEQWKDSLSIEVSNDYKHFIYNIENSRTVVISRKEINFISYAAAFSYNLLFFTVFFLLLLRIIGVRTRNWPKNKFRKLITFSLFSLLIFSILFVGLSSILYTIKQYQAITDYKRDDRARLVVSSLGPYLSSLEPNEQSVAEALTPKLTIISRGLLLDINVYTLDGKLIISSCPEIFTNYIQSTRMNAAALTKLWRKEVSQLTIQEQLDEKSYLSVYIPYHNQNGEFIAFINLPNFLDKENIARDISAIITAYANLYIILMIIAIFMGFALSNRLVQPLNILRRHLQGIDILSAPKYIDYISDDEIGAVVAAYNEMITALDKSAKQLAKSERESAWREMAKQIAHEIKNPLTPMRLSLQHLIHIKKDNHPDWKERFDEISKTLLKQIDTLTKTASEFSSFAKANKSEPSSIDLKTILQEQRPLFDNYPNIRYTATIEVEEALIKAHPEQINRVLMNVLINAVQALEESEHGVISATLRESDTHYRITIEDNGQGIDAEMEAKLFTPNFTTKKSGSGLGLSVCYNILKDYGGSISYSRSSLGGACFTLYLPKIMKDEG
ncbi:MAG: GHKL domain-containing protein [Prevotellaceae bacterium]|jgi:signal transduction histidine kinase|nr:GHKL domain-containing protein [Prevotellaceae bacterium]